jgi:hypothetical protein
MVIGHKWHFHLKNVIDGGVLMITEASQRSSLKDVKQLEIVSTARVQV